MLDPINAISADPAAIRRDLEYMTAHWHELPEPAMIEIRAFKEGSQPQVLKYAVDWMDDAVEAIVNMNRMGRNIYAVRNPVRASISGSASDADIVGARFLWADCDDPAAAGNVYRFDGPKWSAAVTTGNVPSVRVHTYWELSGWCYDLAAWRGMQTTIAAHFASDPTVVNPSRIMRVGGTVSWPSSQKQSRGYISELTTIRTEYEDTRAPVTIEQMLRVFGARVPAARPPSLSQQAQARLTGAMGGLQIDTGGAGPSLDRDATIDAILRGDNWHINMVAAVGSYVARGLKDHEIHAISDGWTLPGYAAQDTRREVQEAIDGARRKGWTPDPQATVARDLTEKEIAAIPAALFKPWTEKDLSAIPYPQFVYSDFYARGYTSVTLAPPKVGKSMLGLAEAIDIATGRGILTGVEREPQRVVYFNAEDDQDVIDSRVAALLTHYRIPQSEIAGRLFPTSGVDMSDFYMVSGQDGIINEPLFVSIEKFIAEEKADALIFDPLQDLSRSPETNEVFRMLGQRLRRMASSTGVALGLIHHTRKIAPGTTPTIDDGRGGSALRGTARFNRLLIGMSEDEGAKAGVQNHRHYLRVGDMESNLAPPSADLNRWFEKTSVITPNGHSVGAIQPWQWPDMFDGISRQDASRVRAAFASMAEPPRENVRSANWAGNVIGQLLNIDTSSKSGKARVQVMLSKWVATDVLRLASVHDPRSGRDTKVVIAGDSNPMTEVDA